MGALTRTEKDAVVGLASRSACEQGSIVCTRRRHIRPRSGPVSQPPSHNLPWSPALADNKACAPSRCCSVLVSTVSEGLTLKGPSTVWFWLRLRKRSLKKTRPTVG